MLFGWRPQHEDGRIHTDEGPQGICKPDSPAGGTIPWQVRGLQSHLAPGDIIVPGNMAKIIKKIQRQILFNSQFFPMIMPENKASYCNPREMLKEEDP